MDRIRHSRFVFGASLAAVAGLIAGLVLSDSLSTGKRAEARTLSQEEATQISRDLQRPDLALSNGNSELAKVARLLSPSVVHIETRYPNAQGNLLEETGSGVVTALSGTTGLYIVTNRHVIRGSKQLSQISIQFENGLFINPIQVWHDSATDVAVLKLPNINVVPARWGDSNQLEIGHLVLALGSPFGLSQSVTLGIVSAKGRRSLHLGDSNEMLNQDFIQTDAAINPGNSGGPLVDLQGRVVGINTAIASNSGGNEGIAFSVPSNLARRVAEALVHHGRVPRSYLGVQLDSDFTAETARTYRLNRLRGARVLKVYQGTPAARAAMRPNDVVLEFNGTEIQNYNHLINMVSLTPVGKTARLTVLREGKVAQIDVRLADRTELEGQANAPATKPQTRTYVPSSVQRELGPSGNATSEPFWVPLEPDLATQVGVASDQLGLVLLSVPESWSETGLQPYDVIIEAARQPIRSDSDWEVVRSAGHPRLLATVLRVQEDGTQRLAVVLPAVDAGHHVDVGGVVQNSEVVIH